MKRRGIPKQANVEELFRTRSIEWSEALETLGQNWKKGLTTDKDSMYEDQYGFMIVTNSPRSHDLFHNGEYLITTHTLDGAKYISTILINDKIKSP